jgi:hypothetical protein
MTLHAGEEMAEDRLDLVDIETAILNGKIVKTGRDPMGRVRYTIQGNAADETSPVAIVGRFTESGRFLIITCYRVAEPES